MAKIVKIKSDCLFQTVDNLEFYERMTRGLHSREKYWLICRLIGIYDVLQLENDCFKATWLVKVSWVFYTMANLVPIIISIVFWVALFDPSKMH